MTVSQDFRKQLKGYGLTTAHIEYYHPDAPQIINPHPFIWQDYDTYPKFPELTKYLDFWQREIDGRLHRVIIAHARLIKPAEVRAIGSEFHLH